jgi:hypothetical protein
VHGGNFLAHGSGVKQHGAILGMQMRRNRIRVQHSITGMPEPFPFRLNRGSDFYFDAFSSRDPDQVRSRLSPEKL